MPPGPSPRSRSDALLWAILVGLLLIACWASLALGYRYYSPAEILSAFAGDGPVAITQYRLPRMVLAPLVGAALGVAGVVVQTLARNRIAAPDTLGLNSGAALAIVIASMGFGIQSMLGLSLAAALGALAASVIVFGIAAAAGGLSSVRIILVGVTMAGLFYALVDVVLAVNEVALDRLMFFLAGSFTDRPLILAANGAPLIALGLVMAWLCAPALDAMQADDATAAGLGVPVGLVRGTAFVSVALLSGAAVAMAGPVAFIGLVVPHTVRPLVGLRHRRQIPVAMIVGAIYATFADVLTRFVIFPVEVPVGAITAVAGGVLLLVFLRRRTA